MKTIILENKTNNLNSLSKKEIVIIDEEKYNKIIEELKDYRKYKFDKNYPATINILNMSQEEFRRTGYSIEYKNGDLYIYDYSWTYDYPYPAPDLVGHLINPRANLLVFMENLKKVTENEKVLNLKTIMDTHPLEYVKKIYDIATKDGLNEEESKNILDELSPQLSLFINEVLSCIKFVQLENININELKDKIKYCEEMLKTIYNYERKQEINKILSEYKSILEQSEYAQENTKILSFAKKISKVN